MQISIAERLRPFDHLPGTTSPVPGSNYALQVFPALICLYDLASSEPTLLAKIKINIQGPVKCFTVQLDLEKGNIVVFGESTNGYFRYRVASDSNGKSLRLNIERQPDQHIQFNLISADFQLSKENETSYILYEDIKNNEVYKPALLSRLSLGSHKSQDWTMIKRRGCLKEILPIWLRLGQTILKPSVENLSENSLLKNCELTIEKGDVTKLLNPFYTLFLLGFKSLMTPRLVCDDYQGVELPILNPDSTTASPLTLLSYGAELITSLFVSFDSHTLKVLTRLPVEFHSGRFLHFRCENLGLLDLGWSKKTIRRMILFAESDTLIDLKFQKEIKSFRLKEKSDSKAKNYAPSDVLKIEKGKTYFFDCFMK